MTRKIKENSKKFHDIIKGCRLTDCSKSFRDTSGNMVFLERYHCLRHNVEVCKCGWEIGWHGAESIKLIKPGARPQYAITRA